LGRSAPIRDPLPAATIKAVTPVTADCPEVDEIDGVAQFSQFDEKTDYQLLGRRC
jgi:hypothetical protein